MIANIVVSFLKKISNHTMIILLCLMFTLIYDQKNIIVNKPHVDESIENLTIVLGFAEDSDMISQASSYYVGVKEYEANDDQVSFTKKLKKENGIDYDVMMVVAIRFDDKLDVKINFINRSFEGHDTNNNTIKYSKLIKNLILYIFH